MARRLRIFLGLMTMRAMSDVTQILSQIESGDPAAADKLLPLIYDELRKLAAAKLAQEKPGQTLQATALVHDAYIRLVNVEKAQHWNSRGHFFGAAAEAMRRILVDQARRKQAEKRGGQGRRVPLEAADVGLTSPADELLDIDAALTRLAADDPQAARLIQLRYFAGLSIEDAAEVSGISRSTAYEHWSYARVRLRTLLGAE
jgi:RNA polymerase sigma factor (TIGR02999 family)